MEATNDTINLSDYNKHSKEYLIRDFYNTQKSNNNNNSDANLENNYRKTFKCISNNSNKNVFEYKPLGNGFTQQQLSYKSHNSQRKKCPQIDYYYPFHYLPYKKDDVTQDENSSNCERLSDHIDFKPNFSNFYYDYQNSKNLSNLDNGTKLRGPLSNHSSSPYSSEKVKYKSINGELLNLNTLDKKYNGPSSTLSANQAYSHKRCSTVGPKRLNSSVKSLSFVPPFIENKVINEAHKYPNLSKIVNKNSLSDLGTINMQIRYDEQNLLSSKPFLPKSYENIPRNKLNESEIESIGSSNKIHKKDRKKVSNTTPTSINSRYTNSVRCLCSSNGPSVEYSNFPASTQDGIRALKSLVHEASVLQLGWGIDNILRKNFLWSFYCLRDKSLISDPIRTFHLNLKKEKIIKSRSYQSSKVGKKINKIKSLNCEFESRLHLIKNIIERVKSRQIFQCWITWNKFVMVKGKSQLLNSTLHFFAKWSKEFSICTGSFLAERSLEARNRRNCQSVLHRLNENRLMKNNYLSKFPNSCSQCETPTLLLDSYNCTKPKLITQDLIHITSGLKKS